MELDQLAERLGYRFKNRALLEQAVTHSSYVAEVEGPADNERLEFLGDAVLGLAITAKLFVDYPGMPEGLMAKVRAAVVNERSLASAARAVDLGRHLRIGKGEDAGGGRDKPSILSDAFEAVLGAIYLDGSYEDTAAVVMRLFEATTDMHASNPGGGDYKTRLQELLAQRGLRPRYEATSSGPDHARHYRVVVYISDEAMGEGEGRSKKIAEQAAAENALEALGDA